MGRVCFSHFLLFKSSGFSGYDRLNSCVAVCLLSFMFYSSCSVFKFTTFAARQWSTPEEIIEAYNSNYQKLRTLKAEGRLSIQSQEFNESATVYVLIKMPDSLKLRLEGPLGIDVANFFIDSNRYLLYLNRDEIVYEGTVDTINVSSLLNETIGLNINENVTGFQELQKEMIGLFAGGYPLDESNLSAVNFADSTRANTIFKLSDPSLDVLFEFPRNREQLERIRFFDETGELRIEKSFERYSMVNNVFIPKRIKYTFYEERGRISLVYMNVEVNRTLNSDEFQIKIPHGLRRESN